ncbi:hypothetical protein [Kribbella sp. NPDC051620]|uniref:hypothetical protein n=1 Tax=Kribbella sp. NPDC051620 TaxID=3364120 RepID=UPI003789814D
MGGKTEAPPHGAVVEDLKALREAGLARLRHQQLDALEDVATVAMSERGLTAGPAIEQALRESIAALDSGEYGDAALALFGLAPGLRARSSRERREYAAAAIDRSADTFARRYEADLLASVADQMLIMYADQRLREARTKLERRHPAESRLAVQWVERFEAYHRMWTPAWALGADLTAYRLTMIEPDRPYDWAPGTHGPDDLGHTQERQAEGYAHDALYRWAWFQWHLRQFTLRHGGMWLLSSSAAETAASDAVYAIDWHVTVFNETDQSWLRNAVAQSRDQESSHFHNLLSSTSTGAARLKEWLGWCQECQCVWDINEVDTEDAHFPTAATHAGVLESCQLHAVVAACSLYCDLIEAEWGKIADWYHLSEARERGRSSADHYKSWRSSLARSEGGSDDA